MITLFSIFIVSIGLYILYNYLEEYGKNHNWFDSKAPNLKALIIMLSLLCCSFIAVGILILIIFISSPFVAIYEKVKEKCK